MFERDALRADGFALALIRAAAKPSGVHQDQAASVGYLSVLQGLLGVWDTSTYNDASTSGQERDGVFTPAEKWICWPTADDAASTVDPNATCNDPTRRVRFNLTYSTHGLNTGLTLFLKDDRIESSWTRRMFSPRVR